MPRTRPSSRRRILLVESDTPSRALVARIVSLRPEVDLVQAATGGTGLRVARDTRPDLVLLGDGLVDLSGSDVLHRLRSDVRTREVPVVVVSADALSEQVDGMLVAGATDYLTKPIDVVQFLAVIDRFTAGRSGTAPA